MEMDASALEEILRRRNPTVDQERAAEASGRWKDYIRERVPRPSWFRYGRRKAWQSAYDRALELGNGSEILPALIVELWYCENPDDVISRAWSRVVFVRFGEGDYEEVMKAKLGNRIVLAQLERARRSCLLPSRYYGPGMVVPYRNQHYVAVQSQSIERVVSVERVVELPAVPKPTRAVPPFSTDVEPAISLGAVAPDLAQSVRELIDRLRIFPKSEPPFLR
jgi:hypothetical protein